MKKFNELNKNDIKRIYTFDCRVEEIKQTSGPTIFTLFDGTKAIKSVGFIKPGARAFPDIETGEIIQIKAEVSQRDGNLELELKSMEKLDEQKVKSFNKTLSEMEDKLAEPKDIPFLINSEVLNALKPMMISVAKEIRKAIFSNRKIILKHHADCDGYCAGMALERAIIPLIKKQHSEDSAEWFFFKRGPSKAPFYDYMDVVKDLSYSIDDMNRFGQKAPLIILADNGSTEEDLLAIKKCKIYGAKVVVVDHHYPGEVKDGKVIVDNYLDAHVNPYLVGYDSTHCAGILGTEVARLINPDVEKIRHLPALAATGDRSKGEDIDKYFKIAESIGLSKEYLKDLAEVVDFESHYVKFMESRGLIGDLLGDDVEKQKKMVSLLIEDINIKKSKVLNAARHYMNIEQSDNKIIMSLSADKVTSRGGYPAIGKTVGMTHDSLIEDYPEKSIVSLGLGPDFITIRMNDKFDFNINVMIKELQKKIPHGAIEGGGHEHAGTVKFLEAAKDEVCSYVFDRLRSI